MNTLRSSVLSDAELGALTWINRNLGKATQTKALTCDIRSTEGIREFGSRSGVSIEDLNKLGIKSRALGCTNKYTESHKAVTQRPQPAFWLYRSVHPSWQEIDGTSRCDVNEKEQDDTDRYNYASEWSNNSCAIDAVLVAAIHTDIWRVKIDVLEPKRILELPLSTKLLRQLVHSSWGMLRQETRNDFRDLIARGLETITDIGFKVGDFVAATDVMAACFHGVPQMSWTECKVGFCCDQKERMIHGNPRRQHHLVMMTKDPDDDQTLGTAISARMRKTELFNNSETCSNEADCQHTYRIIKKLVLDRLPASLVVCAGNSEYLLTHERANAWGVFDNLRVDYHSRQHQNRSAEYEVKCVIFFVRQGHFITRAKLRQSGKKRNEIGHFDGSHRTLVKNWWTDLDEDAAVSILIYQLTQNTCNFGTNK